MGDKPGKVRIIAGSLRGRKLNVSDRDGLRPTPDRVRETLFNWLMNKIQGAHCLDLFAGSGALGFEAASRGAASVLMVDQVPHVVAQLRAHCLEFALDTVEVLQADACQTLPCPPKRFDIVFVDPPFAQNKLALVVDWLDAQWLAPDALIYIEAEKELELAHLLRGWQIIRHKVAGQVAYYLCQVQY